MLGAATALPGRRAGLEFHAAIAVQKVFRGHAARMRMEMKRRATGPKVTLQNPGSNPVSCTVQDAMLHAKEGAEVLVPVGQVVEGPFVVMRNRVTFKAQPKEVKKNAPAADALFEDANERAVIRFRRFPMVVVSAKQIVFDGIDFEFDNSERVSGERNSREPIVDKNGVRLFENKESTALIEIMPGADAHFENCVVHCKGSPLTMIITLPAAITCQRKAVVTQGAATGTVFATVAGSQTVQVEVTGTSLFTKGGGAVQIDGSNVGKPVFPPEEVIPLDNPCKVGGICVHDKGCLQAKKTSFLECGGPAVRFKAGQSNGTISNCVFKEGRISGVVIGSKSNPIVQDCDISRFAHYGVKVEDGGSGRLLNNRFSQNTRAHILLSTGADSKVIQNDISEGGASGIFCRGCGCAEVKGNTITSTSLGGIEVAQSAEPLVINNVITKSKANGIHVYHKGKGIFEGNTISDNQLSGVRISEEADPYFGGVEDKCNKITNNKGQGVLVCQYGRGTIHNCDIKNNALAGIEITHFGDPRVLQCAVQDNAVAEFDAANRRMSRRAENRKHNGEPELNDDDAKKEDYRLTLNVTRMGTCENTVSSTLRARITEEQRATAGDNDARPSARRVECPGAQILIRNNGLGQLVSNRVSGDECPVACLVVVGDGSCPLAFKNQFRGSPLQGVLCMDMCKPVLKENEITNNKLEGVLVVDHAEPSLVDNTIKHNHGSAGVTYHLGGKGQILGGVIESNDGWGVLAKSASCPTLSELTVKSNMSGGVHMTDGGSANFVDCTIEDNEGKCGVQVTQSGFMSMKSTHVCGSTREGVVLDTDTMCQLENNTIEQCEVGLAVTNGVAHVCMGNHIHHNKAVGVHLQGPNCCTVLDKCIVSFTQIGPGIIVDGGGKQAGASVVSSSDVSGRGPTIKECQIQANTSHGLVFQNNAAGDVSLSFMHDNGGNGLFVTDAKASVEESGNSSAVSARVEYLSVVKNRIFCNDQAGCYVVRSSGLFQSNDVYKNTKANVFVGAAAPGVAQCLFSETCAFDGLDCGFLFDSGSKAKLVRCIIHSNAGAGVTVLGSQGPPSLPYLFDCELRDGKDSGILFVGPYAGGDFESNKITDNGAGGIIVRGDNPNAAGAVALGACSGPTVFKNTISGYRCGILVAGGGAGSFVENIISSSGMSGLVVEGSCSNPSFSRNTISRCAEAGVLFTDGAGGKMHNNQIRENTMTGVVIRDRANPVLEENQICFGSEIGVKIVDGGKGSLFRNQIHNNAGGELVVSVHGDPEVVGNELSNSPAHGIAVHHSSKGFYKDNHIHHTELSGLVITNNAEPHLEGNLISDSKDAGIAAHSGAKGYLTQNRIIRSTKAGVVIYSGASPFFESNEICHGMDVGLYVTRAGEGTFEGNNIHGNLHANVMIGEGGNPVIRQNQIFDGREVGVLLEEGSRGLLENNKVFGNSDGGVMYQRGGVMMEMRDHSMSGGAKEVSVSWANNVVRGSGGPRSAGGGSGNDTLKVARDNMINNAIDSLSPDNNPLSFPVVSDLLRHFRWNIGELTFWWTGQKEAMEKAAKESFDSIADADRKSYFEPPPPSLYEQCRAVREQYLAEEAAAAAKKKAKGGKKKKK